VEVVVLNGDKVIGSGSVLLSAESSFTGFTVPITYTEAKTKATKVQVMICSSNRGSYSASEETANVKVTKYTEYVQKAIGAVLTVDNLKFNY
jgi:hypothetical protein